MAYFCALKKEAVGSSEPLQTFYTTTRCHIPVDYDLDIQRRATPKSNTTLLFDRVYSAECHVKILTSAIYILVYTPETYHYHTLLQI
jgi:hypothetical protein